MVNGVLKVFRAVNQQVPPGPPLSLPEVVPGPGVCRNKHKYLNVNALPSYSSSKYSCSLNSFNCYYTKCLSQI